MIEIENAAAAAAHRRAWSFHGRAGQDGRTGRRNMGARFRLTNRSITASEGAIAFSGEFSASHDVVSRDSDHEVTLLYGCAQCPIAVLIHSEERKAMFQFHHRRDMRRSIRTDVLIERSADCGVVAWR